MTIEEILIVGISTLWATLVAVIVALWKWVIQPLISKMLVLVETLNANVPTQTANLSKQTEILEEQSKTLSVISSTGKAAKASSAEHLRLQKEEMGYLNDIKNSSETSVKQGLELLRLTNLKGVLDGQ